MANSKMPVGNIKYFVGDITKVDPKAYGFIYCRITSPKYLHKPIIQTQVETPHGTRTVSGLGTWEDMLFSEEMYNARDKFGYKFEVLHGYLFESDTIFKEYITDMYHFKENTPKGDAMYLISKLLMNSLFGRFALNYNLGKTEIVNDATMRQMATGVRIDMIKGKEVKTPVSVTDPIDFNDGYYMVTYTEDKDIESEDYQITSKSSIGIPVAITALARVRMSQYKLPDSDNSILYTDTDSIVVKNKLDDSEVGKELGKFKLENTYKKSVFLAPKFYGGQLIDSDSEICKIKGLKNKVPVDLLEELLVKDSQIKYPNEKWQRNIPDGYIKAVDMGYTLAATASKRELIYENNRLVATEPYTIKYNKTTGIKTARVLVLKEGRCAGKD